MQSHRTHHIDPAADIAWTPGGTPTAYLYLLDGRTHVVAHRSLAEQRLLERGAFPVAMLSFEPPVAGPRTTETDSETRVDPLKPADAVSRFERWTARN